MKYKVGDKVILKGTKSTGNTNFDEYFTNTGRNKGDIVTISEVESEGYFVKKDGVPTTKGRLAECDLLPLNWRDRFK
jgi:hypothetical protein